MESENNARILSTEKELSIDLSLTNSIILAQTCDKKFLFIYNENKSIDLYNTEKKNYVAYMESPCSRDVCGIGIDCDNRSLYFNRREKDTHKNLKHRFVPSGRIQIYTFALKIRDKFIFLDGKTNYITVFDIKKNSEILREAYDSSRFQVFPITTDKYGIISCDNHKKLILSNRQKKKRKAIATGKRKGTHKIKTIAIIHKRYIICGQFYDEIKIFDIAFGHFYFLTCTYYSFQAIAILHDKYLGSRGRTKTIQVFDFEICDSKYEFGNDKEKIYSIAVKSDKYIVSCGFFKKILVWKL